VPLPRYAELHCHSNFSFLDGASHPRHLVGRAAELGYTALALTDHDGFYGAPRFRLAAEEAGLATVYGVEVGLARERKAPSGAIGVGGVCRGSGFPGTPDAPPPAPRRLGATSPLGGGKGGSPTSVPYTVFNPVPSAARWKRGAP